MVGDGAGVEEFCGLLIAHVPFPPFILYNANSLGERLLCPSDGCSLVPFEESQALQLQFAAQKCCHPFLSKAFGFGDQ